MVLQDHYLVVSKLEIISKDEELYDITGGVLGFNSSILNALVAGARIVLEMGRSLGSALKRSMSGNTCLK
mgnify:FL=1